MTIVPEVSQAQLHHRRQKLRQARRLKLVQTLWRTVAVSGIAGGVIWVATLPGWVIRQGSQVEIAGNKFMSTEAIRSLLVIDYPQSLFRLQPQEIALTLESKAPIAEATVRRQLLPPRLTITVLEREPVAIALPPTSSTLDSPEGREPLGLLDSQGLLMPKDSYTALTKKWVLPSLKVIGSPEQYRPNWPAVYQAVSSCPVKIFEIDWQDPRNVILNTELGLVHLGSDSSQFTTQLFTLAQMQNLPEKVNYSQIAYIDLRNPAAPSIQMKSDTLKDDNATPAPGN